MKEKSNKNGILSPLKDDLKNFGVIRIKQVSVKEIMELLTIFTFLQTSLQEIDFNEHPDITIPASYSKIYDIITMYVYDYAQKKTISSDGIKMIVTGICILGEIFMKYFNYITDDKVCDKVIALTKHYTQEIKSGNKNVSNHPAFKFSMSFNAVSQACIEFRDYSVATGCSYFNLIVKPFLATLTGTQILRLFKYLYNMKAEQRSKLLTGSADLKDSDGNPIDYDTLELQSSEGSIAKLYMATGLMIDMGIVGLVEKMQHDPEGLKEDLLPIVGSTINSLITASAERYATTTDRIKIMAHCKDPKHAWVNAPLEETILAIHKEVFHSANIECEDFAKQTYKFLKEYPNLFALEDNTLSDGAEDLLKLN